MEQRKSVVPRNVSMDPDNLPFEFMPNLPFQYFPSEGHDDASPIPNTATVNSFYHPRIQELNNTAAMEEGLRYSMRGLNLASNSFTNITPSTNYDHISNKMMNGIGSSSGYSSGNSSFESLLREIRLRVAIETTAQRMSMQCSPDSVFNSGDHDHQPSERVELVRERIVSMAKDYSGCRLLQTKIDEGRAEEISMILSEVRDHLHELMTHTLGNYLIQKIFQATNSVTAQQINSILFFIIFDTSKLKDVCIDSHGTRVVQKILQNINSQQISAIAGALKQIVVALMKNVNGSYVIEQCVKLSPPKCKKVILDEVAKNCVDIATNKWGCSAIQRCWVHDQGEATSLLVKKLILNAAVLAEDPYGNYMVQFLVKLKKPEENRRLIGRLRGKYVELCMNKHASNVVEALLKCSKSDDVETIVLELMNSPEFLHILQDPYGNFVAQKALEYTKGRLHKRLFDMILSNEENLDGHIYGARVLAFVKKHRVHV